MLDKIISILVPILFAGLLVSWVLVPNSAINAICFIIFTAICGGLCVLAEKFS